MHACSPPSRHLPVFSHLGSLAPEANWVCCRSPAALPPPVGPPAVAAPAADVAPLEAAVLEDLRTGVDLGGGGPCNVCECTLKRKEKLYI